MSLTIPTQLSPGAVSILNGANRQFLNDLNQILPQYETELIGKYGAEMALIWSLLGQTIVEARTKTRQFDHYEGRRLRQHIHVNADVTGATAGTAITVTLTSADHYNSGTQSPVRVGEAVRISSTGVWGVVTAINKGTDSAHTATIKPVNSSDKLASSGQVSTLLANDILLFSGNIYAGERSTKMEGQSSIIDTISNTTTEVRDDYPISDRANAEAIKVGGQVVGWYYKHEGAALNKKFMFSIEDAVLEGAVANNLTNGSVGTLGAIPKVLAAGGKVGYTANSMALSNFQEATRYLDFNGGAGVYHWLHDIYQGQEIDNLLFGKYPNGALNYGSVDANSKAVTSYGFRGFNIDGYQFQFKKYRGFSPEASYGAYPTGSFVHYRKNFGVLIPQKINVDPETGRQFPSLQVVYQEVKPGTKILTVETGMIADANQTTTAEKVLSQLAFVGSRVFAANQFATVVGS